MKMILAAMVVATVALSLGACTEVSHTETTKRNWDGSVTRDATTVREGPAGGVSVDRETTRTR